MKATLLDAGSLHLADLNISPLQNAVTTLDSFEYSPPDTLPGRLLDTDIALTNKVPLDQHVLSRLPHLKLIVVLATGVNNIDLEAARRQKIAVCNNVDYATNSLVEHTLALMLALARHLPYYQQTVQQGVWQRSTQFCLLDQPLIGLAGKKLGIIGAGNSGRAVAKVARAMGMKTAALQSFSAETQQEAALPREGLTTLLATSDVISIHCPLSDQTRNLIDEAELQLMKRGALLINTSRGGIVNERALARALSKGQLGGAATDVLTEEPPRNGNPLLSLKHPNLIITPHNAWGSRESRQALITQSAEIIQAFQAGNLINCVNGPLT